MKERLILLTLCLLFTLTAYSQTEGEQFANSLDKENPENPLVTTNTLELTSTSDGIVNKAKIRYYLFENGDAKITRTLTQEGTNSIFDQEFYFQVDVLRFIRSMGSNVVTKTYAISDFGATVIAKFEQAEHEWAVFELTGQFREEYDELVRIAEELPYLDFEGTLIYNPTVYDVPTPGKPQPAALSSPIKGTVKEVVETEDPSFYELMLETATGTLTIQALEGGYVGVESFEALVGKEIVVGFEEQNSHTVYDIRKADDTHTMPLHEHSEQKHPDKETFSIIGRYVYAEQGDLGMHIEIEGREGTIYNYLTLVADDSWSDVEVECAVYKEVLLFAHSIKVMQ